MTELPYEFRDPELLELALTHASTSRPQDNERLEFLGDAALDLIVAEALFREHPDLAEGDLTELKAGVVSRKSLAAAARELGLAEMARLGKGMVDRELPVSVLANLYEALLGAVYLDGGLDAACAFARQTLATVMRGAVRRRSGANPKQTLQELCQGRWGVLPIYEALEQRGQAHARAFLVAARIEGRGFPSAWGRTLKEAESWAAHEALLIIAREEEAGSDSGEAPG